MHAKNPNIFPGALEALSTLFKKTEKEVGEPGNVYDLAQVAVPQNEQVKNSIALPLITIVRLCADNINGKKGAETYGDVVTTAALELIK